MKATVDQSTCIGCGLCADICPEVFHMTDDNVAEAIDAEIPAKHENSASEAADSCLVGAITIE
jgi:ferredoxin